MRLNRWTLLACLAAWPAIGAADTTRARCDIYPAGSDHGGRVIGCSFSQRQGYVTIVRDDGVTHELAPEGDTPGNFRDQQGRTVYRQKGLGRLGQIYRFPDISLFVYWDAGALDAPEKDNPTAPFSTRDYDATTLLRCRATPEAEPALCPAGALRMEGGQASVVILSPGGERFTINFLKDGVNATSRKAEARLENDTWTVTIDDREIYEVPRAVIEGG